MKLKEKFDNVEIMFENQIGTLKYDELCEASNKCVEIADKFAIEFHKWCKNNEIKLVLIKGVETYEMLLELYKKEKEL